jgi:hypothetical protein
MRKLQNHRENQNEFATSSWSAVLIKLSKRQLKPLSAKNRKMKLATSILNSALQQASFQL